jgi:hypothetical protein
MNACTSSCNIKEEEEQPCNLKITPRFFPDATAHTVTEFTGKSIAQLAGNSPCNRISVHQGIRAVEAWWKTYADTATLTSNDACRIYELAKIQLKHALEVSREASSYACNNAAVTVPANQACAIQMINNAEIAREAYKQAKNTEQIANSVAESAFQNASAFSHIATATAAAERRGAEINNYLMLLQISSSSPPIPVIPGPIKNSVYNARVPPRSCSSLRRDAKARAEAAHMNNLYGKSNKARCYI